jgi:hypothetical protein
METITFGQCVKGAWHDGWRYAHHRPALVMVIFVFAWLAPLAETILRPDDIPPFLPVTWIPLIVFELARVALNALLVVHTVRFVLLGSDVAEIEPLAGRSYWRYLGSVYGLVLLLVCIVSGAAALAAGALLMIDQHHAGAVMLALMVVGGSAFLAAAISFFLGARLSLLCAHVAVGGRLRLRDTWSDTRGHCWSIWLTQMVSTLPILVIARFGVVYGLPVWHHRVSSVNAFGIALADTAGLCVGAACSAWLYRRYANSRNTLPDNQLQPRGAAARMQQA